MGVSAEAHLAPSAIGNAADCWRLPWLSADLRILDGAAWYSAGCGRRAISASADDQSAGSDTGMVGSTAGEITPSGRDVQAKPVFRRTLAFRRGRRHIRRAANPPAVAPCGVGVRRPRAPSALAIDSAIHQRELTWERISLV